jgi:hypothetical protein
VDRAAVPHALDATGYVIPRVEGRDALACTFVSSKWAGARRPTWRSSACSSAARTARSSVERDDADLVAIARRELRETLGVATMPRLARVARWLRSMPQYELGHPERVARIASLGGGAPVARRRRQRVRRRGSPGLHPLGPRRGRPTARRLRGAAHRCVARGLTVGDSPTRGRAAQWIARGIVHRVAQWVVHRMPRRGRAR